MRYFFLISIFLFTSCGANYHLRQAKKHLLIANAKGAKINTDTVFVDKLVPQIKVDTVLKNITVEKLFRDTIIVIKNNQVIKIKYVPTEKLVYVKSETKKPVYIKVPVKVIQTISAGKTIWDLVILACVSLLVGFIVGVIYKTRQWKKASL